VPGTFFPVPRLISFNFFLPIHPITFRHNTSFIARCSTLNTSFQVVQFSGRCALEADLHRAYIGQIERGEKNIGVKNLEKITKALKIKPAKLLKDMGTAPCLPNIRDSLFPGGRAGVPLLSDHRGRRSLQKNPAVTSTRSTL